MRRTGFRPRLWMLLAFLLCTPVRADWVLTPESSLAVVSVKQYHRPEIHRFEDIEGRLYPSGEARLDIQLASIATGVENRDSRLRDELFEVARFPRARIRVKGDMTQLQALAPGEAEATTLNGSLSLHDREQEIQAAVTVLRLRSGGFRVLSRHPVLLDVRDFGLGASVRLLATLARLDHISYAIPVSFDLVFRPS